MMKIAIDYQSTQGRPTGIGVSAKHIMDSIQKIRPEWSFDFCTTRSPQDLNTPNRMLWESWTLPLRMKKSQHDLLYSPGFAPPLFCPIPKVVTVHDLIGMIYPENLPRAARFYWSRWLPACIRRATVVVASSESTKRDMMRLLNIAESRIRVIPLAASEGFHILSTSEKESAARLGSFNLKKPYLLTVGTLEPRKNILKLLEAFAMYRQKLGGSMELALAGKSGGEEHRIKETIMTLGLESTTHLLGYVSDEDLNFITNQSLGYAIVSSYEGFGLPVLEAMQCGKTGLCSQVSSLPEIAGDTAYYVNPESVEDIANQMLAFEKESELRASFEQRAYERSKQFTWDKTAKAMIEVFEGLC